MLMGKKMMDYALSFRLLLPLLAILQCICARFMEPIQIEILPDRTYDFSIEYCSFSAPPRIDSMSALCYCQYNVLEKEAFDCSIPGPTFIFYANTNISMTFHNNLKTGYSFEFPINNYRDLDVTNIHLHGIHISPFQDDVSIKILPGQSYTYNYNIMSDHYPGTHWLHAHHHGSVSFQTGAGLFSALLLKYSDNNKLIDDSLINMKENVIILHYIHAINTELCDCNDKQALKQLIYDPMKCANKMHHTQSQRQGHRRHIHCDKAFSLCYEYCLMPSIQRKSSGFTYYANIGSAYATNFQVFLVNGNVEPVIDDLSKNKFRRLRFINTVSQFYVQYKFPIEYCEWYLIAIDGIFLTQNTPRSLNNAPYHGEYLSPPGGRIDVIVKCTKIGIYDIKTSQNSDQDEGLSKLFRAPENIKLFSIEIIPNGHDYVSELPKKFPAKPAYLTDTREMRSKSCECNTYFDNLNEMQRTWITWDKKQCGLVFSVDEQKNHMINLKQFNPSGKPMTYLDYNSVYEFIMISDNHPYHQHIIPFQMQENVGNQGFIAFNGDWYDTLGAYSNIAFNIRIHTADFTGPQIIHCHNLPHEDLGMMTFVEVLPPDQHCNNDNEIYEHVFKTQNYPNNKIVSPVANTFIYVLCVIGIIFIVSMCYLIYGNATNSINYYQKSVIVNY